jgi:hypothetical protein
MPPAEGIDDLTGTAGMAESVTGDVITDFFHGCINITGKRLGQGLGFHKNALFSSGNFFNL